MRKYVEVFTRDHLSKLRDQLLFSGLTDHEIFMFIQYAKPYYLSLNRGETARVENKFSHMTGLVFSGTAYLYSVDYNGNKSLLKTIRSGESSGTLYAMFDYYNTLVEIMAGEDCEILFIPPEPMFITEDSLASIQQKSSSICLRHKDRCFCRFRNTLPVFQSEVSRANLCTFFKSIAGVSVAVRLICRFPVTSLQTILRWTERHFQEHSVN